MLKYFGVVNRTHFNGIFKLGVLQCQSVAVSFGIGSLLQMLDFLNFCKHISNLIMLGSCHDSHVYLCDS